jgi:hypothetical protein
MIAATLALPSQRWRPNHNETTIEVFPDLESVIVAMTERYHSRGRTLLHRMTLDGRVRNMVFPTFVERAEFTCYSVAGALDGEPSDEQVMDALTDVHSQVWTWELTLMGSVHGMYVKVRANR